MIKVQTFPLDRAAEAYRISEAGHVRGKLVLVPLTPHGLGGGGGGSVTSKRQPAVDVAHGDPAGVRLHHAAGDGQPQTGAAVRLAPRWPAAPAGVEDPVQVLLGDAAAAVDRPRARTCPSSARRPSSRTARSGLGVPDRVADQVGHRPGQIVGRTEHREPVVVGQLDLERDACGCAPWRPTPTPRRSISSVSDTSVLRLGLARAPLHPGQLEQVVDQDASSGPPCPACAARARGTSSITPSSSPSASARSPASGVRRSWDMKLTSSCRRASRRPARARRDSASVAGSRPGRASTWASSAAPAAAGVARAEVVPDGRRPRCPTTS